MKIGVFLFDGSEELDWAGPWEVLASWAQLWPDDGVEVGLHDLVHRGGRHLR